jgi:DNA-binding MarR family transcriptional regulator
MSRPPATTRLDALLDDGDDSHFRQTVQNMILLALQVRDLREGLGATAGLTGAQYTLLMALADLGDGDSGNQGAPVSDLARRLNLTAPTVTVTINQLAKADLVVRSPNPDDRRGTLVALTASGGEVVARLRLLLLDINDLTFADFSPKEFNAFAQALKKLRRGLWDAATDLERRRHFDAA